MILAFCPKSRFWNLKHKHRKCEPGRPITVTIATATSSASIITFSFWSGWDVLRGALEAGGP